MSRDYIRGKTRIPSGPEQAVDAEQLEQRIINCPIAASTTYDADTRAFEINFTGVFPGPAGTQTGGMEGLRIVLEATGVDGRRQSGIYSVVKITDLDVAGIYQAVTGTSAAGEFEIQATGTGDLYTYACVQLRHYNTNATHGMHPASAYMRLRDAGTVYMPNLFNIVNESATATANTRMVSKATACPAVNDDGWSMIKIFVNNISYWIPITDTAPS